MLCEVFAFTDVLKGLLKMASSPGKMSIWLIAVNAPPPLTLSYYLKRQAWVNFNRH